VDSIKCSSLSLGDLEAWNKLEECMPSTGMSHTVALQGAHHPLCSWGEDPGACQSSSCFVLHLHPVDLVGAVKCVLSLLSSVVGLGTLKIGVDGTSQCENQNADVDITVAFRVSG
jgi:hypothetical protein